MHLIIGLGNPGKKYIGTRHNIGFSCLDFVRKQWEFPSFRENSSFRVECSEGRVSTEKVLLVRPSTFMNRSGDAVRNISQFYKIKPQHIAIIHDDLDIPLGEARESFGSRSAGHNGVEDIIGALRTKDFLRFRVGIKSTPRDNEKSPPKNPAEFVLEAPSNDDRAAIEATFPKIATRLREWLLEEK